MKWIREDDMTCDGDIMRWWRVKCGYGLELNVYLYPNTKTHYEWALDCQPFDEPFHSGQRRTLASAKRAAEVVFREVVEAWSRQLGRV